MDRKKFIKKTLAGLAGVTLGSNTLTSELSAQPKDKKKFLARIGFNHLPNKEEKTMKTVLHKADTRGTANHGWLNSKHSFSFANYHNPERMNFGVLRVLNDDIVAPARGFGKHPHNNMEIISIPLAGDMEHQDSMGNKAVIREGDVQVMSAGKGIFHSEYNKNKDKEVRFLQIWVFPNKGNVQPRYDQISLADVRRDNTFYQILSPSANDQGVWVHQDAWFHLGEFEAGSADTYQVKKSGNGVYIFMIEGEAMVDGQKLEKRDGFGIWDTESFTVVAGSKAKILLMEVPMAV